MKVARSKILGGPPAERRWAFIPKVLLLSPLYLGLAEFRRRGGLILRANAARIGLKLMLQGEALKEVMRWLFFPMDSVRYLELQFLRDQLKETTPRPLKILDLSSPRFALLIALNQCKAAHLTAVNPDAKDLDFTRRLISRLGFGSRVDFAGATADELQYPTEVFDLVTAISVLEHIPPPSDSRAFKKLWDLVAPGGQLIVTLPCAHSAYEEHIDYDEYGLLSEVGEGFFFSQTFFDQALLQERFLSQVCYPSRQLVFGETRAGLWEANRREKFADRGYPIWREPWLMAAGFSRFETISELPGVGVVCLAFRKRPLD